MQWKQILSTKRAGEESGSRRKDDLRSEFEKDYHKIISSASFRRLQDKTQVFPLDKSDFIRTRLTHSLEVSSIGRSLAQNISESIIERRLDTTFTLETEKNVAAVIECAGLIHDIGNPPFGHFGEEAIREWFVGHLPRLVYGGRRVTDILSRQETNDFLHFEGNAQGLRLVSKLHFSENGCGLNLTYGLLTTMIKYPRSSVEMNPKAMDIADKKMGYFKAEQDLFRLRTILPTRPPISRMLTKKDFLIIRHSWASSGSGRSIRPISSSSRASTRELHRVRERVSEKLLKMKSRSVNAPPKSSVTERKIPGSPA